MTLTKAVPIQNAAPVPLDGRRADMAKVVANVDGSPRVGVLGPASGLLTALATMNVAVAAAEFVTSKGKADGVSIFTNDGTVNVPIAAAPASNSRITVIWVKHNDDTTGDGDALPTFGTTDGTAAATPTKPAIPTGALELGTLRVYAGTSAANGGSNVLTETYQMTAMRGGVVPFRTLAELTAWTSATSGQVAYVIGGNLYEATGSAWAMQTFAEAAGSVTFGSSGGANYLDVAVSFPAGRFTQPPLVLVGTQANTSGSTLSAAAVNVTTGGFTARMAFAGGWISTYTIPWHAVQMTPTSAAG